MDQDLIDALRVVLDRARQHIPAYCHKGRDGENAAHIFQTDACNLVAHTFGLEYSA